MVAYKSLTVYFALTVSFLVVANAVPQRVNGTDGRQYIFEVDQKYNWYEAHNACARLNFQLVEIESGMKNLVVLAFLKAYLGNSQNLWIGANDEYNTSKFRPIYWTPSGQRMIYSYWNSGQPDNNGGVEHCVHTWAVAENFKWNDAQCTIKMGFICEQKMPC